GPIPSQRWPSFRWLSVRVWKAGAANVMKRGLDLDLCGKVYPRLMADDELRIGEVAARSGMTRKALRLYEARGIVPKPRRTGAGYRVYDADVLGVLHFVIQSRRLGLTLKEIGHIIDLRSAKRGPCVHVRALLEQK